MLASTMLGFMLLLANDFALAGQSEAEDAVTRILFDNDMENVSYSVPLMALWTSSSALPFRKICTSKSFSY